MTRTSMIEGRQSAAARRRQRVGHAIDSARRSNADLSVAAIARAAGVDRTFLYRHRDLLAQLHAAQTDARNPADAARSTSAASRASVEADLANAQGQLTRQAKHVRQLEHQLSQLLGEHAWRQAGLGPPADVDELQRRVTHLEQRLVDLQEQLNERGQELAAARAANRELMANLNRRTT